MNRLTKSLCRFLVGALLWTASALPALAQTSPLSDWLKVFDPAGNLYKQVFVTEADEDPLQIYYIDDPTLANPAQFGNFTALIESDGSFSDVFGIANVNNGLFLAFSSDIEGVPSPYGPGAPIVLPEGPGDNIYDATQYLNPTLIAQGFHAQFFSDGEVPEPASAVILIAGLMLPIFSARRRR